ncbi:MAG: hypothetical protein ACREGJ_03545 [Candidatus Saccharimonadales bacterium]
MAVTPNINYVLMNDNVTTNTSSVTLTPDASWQAGDIMIAAFAWNNSSTLSPPTGWTAIGSSQYTVSTVFSAAFYYRFLQAGDTNWAWSIGTTTRYVGIAQAFDGVDTTSPIHASANLNTTSSTSADAPALTTSIDDFYLLNLWPARWSSATGRQSIVVPGTHTAGPESGTALSSTTSQATIRSGALTTQPTAAGMYGPYTATTINALSNCIAFSIALKASIAVATAKVRIGGVWVEKPIKARVGGAWV